MGEPLSLVLSKLKKTKRSGAGWSGLCPAHDDHEPSLSVTEGADGRVLLMCHKGCTTEDVAKALGMEMKDLFVPRQQRPAFMLGTASLGEPEAVYPYTDEEGALLFEVLRFKGKKFRRCSRDDEGKWRRTSGGLRQPLYNLPEVVRAIADNQTIYVVEGEKDVENLRRLGLVATTNPSGAGAWRAGHTASLKGAGVVVIPDNDTVGRDHARRVAASLAGVAATVRLVELDGDLPDGGDVSDWIADGGTAERLRELVLAAPEYVPESESMTYSLDDFLDPVASSHFIRASELEKLPPIRWVVEGFVPVRGNIGIFGDPEAGKSFVMIDLACAVALGQSWHGHEVQQGSVAIVAAEGADGLGARITSWKAAHGAADADLDIHVLPVGIRLLDEGNASHFLEQLGDLPQPLRIVFIDTLAPCLAPDGDENTARDMGKVMQTARQIASTTGAAVVFIHHSRKGTSVERGSTAFRGAADVMIAVTRHDDFVTVRVDKVRDAVPSGSLSLELVSVSPSAVLMHSEAASEDTSTEHLTANDRAILEALRREGPISSSALQTTSRVKHSSFYRTVNKLLRLGYISKDVSDRTSMYRAVVEEEREPAGTPPPAAQNLDLPAPCRPVPPSTTPFRGGTVVPPRGVVDCVSEPFLPPRQLDEEVSDEGVALGGIGA